MVWLGSLSSQLAIPIWSQSVRRATMGSFRIQVSSHTWLCWQFPSHFSLHLAAPTRVLTSQQRLWKRQIGEQVLVIQYCVLLSLPQLSQAPLAVAAAFPTKLMRAARWTGGGCGKQQIIWTQTGTEAATRKVHSFPPSTSSQKSHVATKALQIHTASGSMGH